MTKYELYIKADYNDADYVTSTETVDAAFIRDIVAPVVKSMQRVSIEKAGKFYHNWSNGEHRGPTPSELYPELTEEQLEMFNDVAPYNEHGIHTIVEISYYPLPEKIILWNGRGHTYA